MHALRAQVIVFAKRPRSGEVKTRLAASLGVDMAVQAYRELLTDVVSKLGPAEAWDLSLAVTPDDAVDDEEAWPVRAPRRPQGGGDLGRRLERVLAGATQARPVLVVGSDVPGLTAGAVQDALDRLAQVDVVLGPSPDGGYWAIGVSRPPPAGWLDGVRWSSPHALEDTLQGAVAAGLDAAVLDLWLEDVDDLASYRRWREGG